MNKTFVSGNKTNQKFIQNSLEEHLETGAIRNHKLNGANPEKGFYDECMVCVTQNLRIFATGY